MSLTTATTAPYRFHHIYSACGLLFIRERMNKILEKHTGQPAAKIRLDTERDKYLSAEDAKAYGIIDNVIAARESKDSKDGK